MELNAPPTENSDGTAQDHHDFYLPAMPPVAIIEFGQWIVNRLNRYR